MSADLRVRTPRRSDAERVRAIDAAGIATGHASFRSTPHEWEAWCDAYSSVGLVAERDGYVVGWAGVSPLSDHCTGAGVGEVSVYVGEDARGTGIGRRLLRALVEASEDVGYWTLVAQCFPENEGSVRLHEGAGFRRVGLRERLGRMTHGPEAGRWRDVVMLERRSERVGL